MRFIYLFILLSLVGCQQQSKEKIALLKLKTDAVVCQQHNSVSNECQQSVKNYQRTIEAFVWLQSNPQQFGQDIIALQVRLSALKAKPLTSKNRDKIGQLTFELQRLMILIAIYESP